MYKSLIRAVVWVFLICSAVSNHASDMFVPQSYQAKVIQKVCLNFISENTKVTIIVNRSDLALYGSLAHALRDGLFQVEIIAEEVLAQAVGDVIYLAPGLSPKTLELLTHSSKFVITGMAEYVRNGQASFGVIVEDGEIKMLTNLAHLRQGVARQNPRLLDLAKISTTVD